MTASSDQPDPILSRIDADARRLRAHYRDDIASLLQRRQRSVTGWLFWPAMAALALLLSLVSQDYPRRTIEADAGRPRSLVLADGSKVFLDAGAVVDIPYAPWSRRIILRHGRAMLDVVHHDFLAFDVRTEQAVLRDLGTRFLVEAQDDRTKLAVFEGAVRLRTKTQTTAVTAGQAAEAMAMRPITILPMPDEAVVTAWSQGRLIFRGTSLAEVADTLTRYSPDRPVRVDDKIIGLRVSGVFDIEKRDAILRTLETVLPVKVRSQAGVVLLAPDASLDARHRVAPE